MAQKSSRIGSDRPSGVPPIGSSADSYVRALFESIAACAGMVLRPSRRKTGLPAANRSYLENPAAIRNLRVLLVDDDANESYSIRSALQGAGADVKTAGDGSEAVAMALDHQIDFILMDLAMPILDGVTATLQLRAYGFDRPICEIGPEAAPADRHRYIDHGFDGYVPRPVRPKSLIDEVARLVHDPRFK